MRIGFYTNAYKPRINGVVRSISVFRQALQNQGHEVYLFAPAAPGYADTETGLYRYPALPIEGGRTYRPPITISPSLFRLATQLGMEVVHTHQPVLLGKVAARVARATGVPLVYTIHSRYDRYGESFRVGGRLVTYFSRLAVVGLMRQCQRIVAPTAVVRDVICRDAPELCDRIVVIPTPLHEGAFERVDPEPIRIRYGLNGCFTYVVTARLTAEKGLSDVVQAFARVRHHRADVRLLVLGDGPERENLVEETYALRIADSVTFVGMVPFEQVAAHLRAADAFVFASQLEVQPLVLNEAMAAGLPVVAYDAPFVRDVVTSGSNGLLSAPHYRALAVKMEALAGQRALCDQLSREAERSALRFSAPETAIRLLEVYQEAIEEMARQGGAAAPRSLPRRYASHRGAALDSSR